MDWTPLIFGTWLRPCSSDASAQGYNPRGINGVILWPDPAV